MIMRSLDLAAAVASRICHDLVSPVGAVVNGVDLLRETGPVEIAETAGMIGQSAARASALLQFYRVAFGAAGEDAQPIGRGALRELLSVLAQPPRILLDWRGDGPPMSRAEARLLGLLALCARSVTGMRGVISIRPGTASAFPLEVTVEADAFASALDRLGHLDDGPAQPPLSPRSVEFVLARKVASAMGAPLHLVRDAGRVTMTAGAPELAGMRPAGLASASSETPL
jgi:histidine phosphotransferase ChpT